MAEACAGVSAINYIFLGKTREKRGREAEEGKERQGGRGRKGKAGREDEGRKG